MDKEEKILQELKIVKEQRDILIQALEIIKKHQRKDWSFFIENYLDELKNIETNNHLEKGKNND